MTITLRTATEADLPTLRAFEEGIVQAERPFDDMIKPDPVSYYDLGAMVASEDAEVVLAQDDGVPIASGFAQKRASRSYIEPGFHAYIGFLFVEPSHRGQGINQSVLDHLFDWARSRQLHEVRLTVYPGNEAAMRAYEKAGFEPYILEMRQRLED